MAECAPGVLPAFPTLPWGAHGCRGCRALEQKVWQALADKRNVQAVESMVDDDDPAELEAEAQYQMASM